MTIAMVRWMVIGVEEAENRRVRKAGMAREQNASEQIVSSFGAMIPPSTRLSLRPPTIPHHHTHITPATPVLTPTPTYPTLPPLGPHPLSSPIHNLIRVLILPWLGRCARQGLARGWQCPRKTDIRSSLIHCRRRRVRWICWRVLRIARRNRRRRIW